MDPTATRLDEIGEIALIERLHAIVGTSRASEVLQGIGDDAAVIDIGDGRVQVVTTDALVEGVHFEQIFTPMELLGFKALSATVSDVVAMNALPRYATVALGAPAETAVARMDAIYQGLHNAADAYGVTILGGDTTRAQVLTLTLTALGEAQADRITYRSGAVAGDAICVTGNLGAAHAGLRLMLREARAMREQKEDYRPDLGSFEYVLQRHLAPVARLRTIQDWNERGVQPTALIDISDGLATDLHHLCNSSVCGAQIDANWLPIAPETLRVAKIFGDDAHDYALFGGEDYELLFTVPEESLGALDPGSFRLLGYMTGDEGVTLATATGVKPLPAGGYAHFDNL